MPKGLRYSLLGFAAFMGANFLFVVIANRVNPEGFQSWLERNERAADIRAKARQAARAADELSEKRDGEEYYARNTEVTDPAEIERGMHCLTAYDGSNLATKYDVQELLRNPDSFEHVETRIFPDDGGEHGLWMTYRAENGFGGTAVERIYARVDHETCQARLLPGGPGT